VGVTTNPIKRLAQYNNKENSFTAAGVPWKLVWASTKPTRDEAEALEFKIKNLSRERKIKFMKKYHKGLREPDLWHELD
jgi:putative endonuclease